VQSVGSKLRLLLQVLKLDLRPVRVLEHNLALWPGRAAGHEHARICVEARRGGCGQGGGDTTASHPTVLHIPLLSGEDDSPSTSCCEVPVRTVKCLLGVYNSSTSLIKTQRAECKLLE
jgi:hypothetical protein